MFDLNVTGEVKEATDSLLRNGKLRYELQTHDLAFLLQTLPASERARYNLPPLHLKGEAQLQQQRYKATLSLRPKDEAGGVLLMAKYLPNDKSYAVTLQIDSLHPTLFLPQDSLYYLSASLRAEGKGTDPFSPATQAELKGGITDIRYGSYALSDVRLAGELKENLLKFDLLSRYPLAEIDLSLNATLRKEKVEAMLIADVENFDLYRMHLLTDSLATSFQLFAEAQSDLGKNNRLDVSLGNWKLTTPTATFQPKMLTLHAASDPDTTRVSFHAGDFGIVLTGNADVETLANQFANSATPLTQQLEQDSSIHIPALRPLLPGMYMQITAGKDNPLHAILEQQQISFDQMTVTARTSPDEGLFLDTDLVNLMQDTTRIDTVCFIARQDSLGIRYDTRIVKKPFRKQQPFTAGVNGHIRNTFADAELRYLNGKGETGILIGFRLGKEPDGFRLHLFPEHPVLAFRPFQLNPDNYILYRNLNDIAADVRLTGEENASLWIHSEAEGKRMEEIHAELSQINLQALSEGFPNLPALRGMLNANLQYAPSDSNFLSSRMPTSTACSTKENESASWFSTVFTCRPINKDIRSMRTSSETAMRLRPSMPLTKPDSRTAERDNSAHFAAIRHGKPFHSGRHRTTKRRIGGRTDCRGDALRPDGQRLFADRQRIRLCDHGRQYVRFDTQKHSYHQQPSPFQPVQHLCHRRKSIRHQRFDRPPRPCPHGGRLAANGI